ncbi:MAG: chalcone isomerase family protein [Alphaproteobacteria bacterium]|nr:chalcone isomerase family protein [Alphaproteobacteria bacterium]
MHRWSWTSALLALSLSAPAFAGELAGVTVPDSVTVGDTPLVLNGLGLREFLWIDIYVGGLYLPEKTKDAAKAMTADVPKRVVMEFIFRKVSRQRMVDTFRDGFAAQGLSDTLKDRLAKLEAMMDGDVVAGDTVVLDYVPGTGLTVSFNGKAKGTIEGADFMQAVLGIYIGDKPASEKLKAGMLGG